MKDITIIIEDGYIRKAPVITINLNSSNKNVFGNNKILVVGGDEPLIRATHDTTIENLHVTAVKEVYTISNKTSVISRLKFLLTGDINKIIKSKV